MQFNHKNSENLCNSKAECQNFFVVVANIERRMSRNLSLQRGFFLLLSGKTFGDDKNYDTASFFGVGELCAKKFFGTKRTVYLWKIATFVHRTEF